MNNAAAAIDNGRRAARSLDVAAAVRRSRTAAPRCARTSWCNAGRRRSLASKNETRATGSRTVAAAGGESGMATAILLVLVAVGSVVFHFLSPWWWTPIASNWAYIDPTIIITFWITGVV